MVRPTGQEFATDRRVVESCSEDRSRRPGRRCGAARCSVLVGILDGQIYCIRLSDGFRRAALVALKWIVVVAGMCAEGELRRGRWVISPTEIRKASFFHSPALAHGHGRPHQLSPRPRPGKSTLSAGTAAKHAPGWCHNLREAALARWHRNPGSPGSAGSKGAKTLGRSAVGSRWILASQRQRSTRHQLWRIPASH